MIFAWFLLKNGGQEAFLRSVPGLAVFSCRTQLDGSCNRDDFLQDLLVLSVGQNLFLGASSLMNPTLFPSETTLIWVMVRTSYTTFSMRGYKFFLPVHN